MLSKFIRANREQIIERARKRLSAGDAAKSPEAMLERDVSVFLARLIDSLARAGATRHWVADTAENTDQSAMTLALELFGSGATLAQVVRGYGDLRQVVSELASEQTASKRLEAVDRYFDDAIADAVTAHQRQRARGLARTGDEALIAFARELRTLTHELMLSFAVIQHGMVGLAGSAAARHARGLSALSAHVERSLAELRLAAGVSTVERVSVPEFVDDLTTGAAMRAAGFDLQLKVSPVQHGTAIDADRQLLACAVTNLLHNAFKFTRPRGTVSLMTRATHDRVMIDVCDECGGFPARKSDGLVRPPADRGSARSDWLGLTSIMAAVRANSATLGLQSIPGQGCVFTINLPRQR